MLIWQGGSEAVYKDMIRNYKSTHKKYLDAIRFKAKQELKDFKQHHNSLVKQLACSSRKKKPEDLSLGGVGRIFKESLQNDRILNDMVKEAATFDNRLKKVGLKIDITELINDQDKQKDLESKHIY